VNLVSDLQKAHNRCLIDRRPLRIPLPWDLVGLQRMPSQEWLTSLIDTFGPIKGTLQHCELPLDGTGPDWMTCDNSLPPKSHICLDTVRGKFRNRTPLTEMAGEVFPGGGNVPQIGFGFQRAVREVLAFFHIPLEQGSQGQRSWSAGRVGFLLAADSEQLAGLSNSSALISVSEAPAGFSGAWKPS